MKQTILRGLLAAGLTAAAATTAAMPAGECTLKGNSYTFLVDYSGSMMESPEQDELTRKEKQEREAEAREKGIILPEPAEKEKRREKTKRIATAKDLISRLEARLPKEMQSGLYTVAPYTEIAPYKNREKQDLKEKTQTLKENMEVLGRRSPIGQGIEQQAARMEKSGLNGPVYLITDGRQVYGRKIREAVETFYKTRPESCLHIISLADTKEGQKTVETITSANPCSHTIRAKEIQDQPGAASRFIEKTIETDCKKKSEKILSVSGIHFAFDRYDIDEASEKILQKALEYIHAQDEKEKIEIIGWTDWMGSDTYNKRLSQKRAEAVKKWLEKKGIPTSRMKATGKGKSYRYDNRTEKGRYLNRRMDFRFYTEE